MMLPSTLSVFAADSTDTVTLYYDNSTTGWSTVYAYAWNSSGNNNSWPGTAMTKVDGADNIYTVDIPSSVASAIIFNDGGNDSSNRTADLEIPTDGRNLYNGSTWEKYPPGALTVQIDTGSEITLYADSDGYYKIGTADELYAFAALVNNGDTSINGKLTSSITVNAGYSFTFTADTGLIGVKKSGTIIAYLGTGRAGDTSGANTGFDTTASVAGTVYLYSSGEYTEGEVSALATLRQWTPIGNDGYRYTGIFDGKGFTVSGLYFNESTTNYTGLFGYVGVDGQVQNVGILDSCFCAQKYTGGVVGSSRGAITGCYSESVVRGSSFVGGIAGYNYKTVTDSHNTGAVIGSADGIGGIVGCNQGGTNAAVTNCYNTGNVTGSGWVGGLAGMNSYTIVTNCYNTGSVTGTGKMVGGLLGSHGDYPIQNCYNTGNVTGGSDAVGGLIGTSSGTKLTNCYNTGTVTCAGKYIGGVVGRNISTDTITGCYYLEGTADGALDGADAEGQAESKTKKQFESGEVAYLLNGSTSTPEEGKTLTWYQTIGTDDSPKFSGKTVYKLIPTCNADIALYSNTNETVGHSYADGICEYCGASDSPVGSWSLTLDDNILVNFNLNVAETDAVTFTVAGSSVEAVIDGSNYSIALAAAQMTDEIVIYVNGEALEETYSVRKYADYILDEANGYDEKTVTLVKEMLNYGGAAQTYFGYNTTDMANAGITGVGTADIPEDAAPDMVISGSVDGISFYAASLVYRDRIAVRYYFTVTGSISDYAFSVGGVGYTPVSAGDGLYYVEVNDIVPQDLANTVTVTVNDTLSVTYCPMNYIVRMSTKGTENLQPLVKALYNCHLAAKAFVAA